MFKKAPSPLARSFQSYLAFQKKAGFRRFSSTRPEEENKQRTEETPEPEEDTSFTEEDKQDLNAILWGIFKNLMKLAFLGATGSQLYVYYSEQNPTKSKCSIPFPLFQFFEIGPIQTTMRNSTGQSLGFLANATSCTA